MMFRWRVAFVVVCMLSLPTAVTRGDNFAASVVDTGFCDNEPDYRPGMGQFVNNTDFNDPNRAVGAPIGGGHSIQDNSKIVSLGAFGGQIILAFDHDVYDDPANPFGVDAIVFSNAVWADLDPNFSGGQYHQAEPAMIEIMPELNGNAIPGDDSNERWYLVQGSHLGPSSVWKTMNWDPAGVYPTHPPMWYPSVTHFPNRPAAYSSSAWELTVNYRIINGLTGILVNPNLDDGDPNNDDDEGLWGYAEYSPTRKLGDRDGDNSVFGHGDDANLPAGVYYATADDPLKVGITRGSGGGDGFDIQWAVDPQNGWQSANLAHFRYIRITNAVDYVFGVYDPNEAPLGEASPEIGGVADARPLGDLDADQDVDGDDYETFVDAWSTDPCDMSWNAAADIDVDDAFDVDLADYGLLLRGWQLHNELAEPNEENGELQIQAYVVEGDLDAAPGYAVIKIAGRHTGTGDERRWFNGLRALSGLGGGLWVDPNAIDAVEIVHGAGTLVPGNPPEAVQINTESDAETAEQNWETYGGSGQAVEYDADLDTWVYDAFSNFLDTPGPDDANNWEFTATQSPNTLGDYVELLHLVIRKKAGYDGSPVRLYLAGQWGLVGEAPNPTFSGLVTALDPNSASDTKIGVLRLEPLRRLTLRLVGKGSGMVVLEPDVPPEPPYAYYDGTEVTLGGVPIEGKSFKEWEVYDPNYPGDANHVFVDTNDVLRLTMDADYDVKATFTCGTGIQAFLPILVVILGLAGVVRRR